MSTLNLQYELVSDFWSLTMLSKNGLDIHWPKFFSQTHPPNPTDLIKWKSEGKSGPWICNGGGVAREYNFKLRFQAHFEVLKNVHNFDYINKEAIVNCGGRR